MRRIDADALKEHFADMQKYEKCACNFEDGRGEPSTNWYCVEDAVDNAPTVEAIPVGWLRSVQKDSTCDAAIMPFHEAIGWIIEMWKNEQEAR